jgi:hypothetical protein
MPPAEPLRRPSLRSPERDDPRPSAPGGRASALVKSELLLPELPRPNSPRSSRICSLSLRLAGTRRCPGGLRKQTNRRFLR